MVKHATVDSKGRLTLGTAFANSTVLIEHRGDDLVIRRTVVIPASEAWLYENPKALKSVRKGLAEAKARKLTRGPDMSAGAKLAKELAD
ncbi:MAG: hypothetical protein SGJ11_08615 [Phycisphaerae bacterium]|nr:hypothetical protein [Phycisphaerae bacterium]